jgi:chorismate dehydratase
MTIHPIDFSSATIAATTRVLPGSVRLGAISFINTVPVYFDFPSSFEEEGLPVTLFYDVPARLNARMIEGELDVSPVSSAFYLRHRERLVLLDDLSVSSPGAVESVIFLSERPWGQALLDFSEFRVPDDSETSIALLAHLLQDATGCDLRERFRTYEAARYPDALAESGNALIIGDNALMAQALGLGTRVRRYDLSSLWGERTGLPFVFAVWAADAAWAARHPETLAGLNRVLCRARDRFYADPDVFRAGVALAQHRSGLPEATLRRYYTQCLTYGLDAEHHAALARFDGVLRPLTPSAGVLSL